MTCTKIVKFLALGFAICIAAGCKIAVISAEGGDVTSLSSTRDCDEGDNCIFEVTDPAFSETFTAVPKPGFEFVRWQAGMDFQCGDSTNLNCTVALPSLTIGQFLITLFELRYIMPIYKDVDIDTDLDGDKNRVDTDDDNDLILDVVDACPLVASPSTTSGCPAVTDIVTANGEEWIQPDLFRNLTWDEISAACPAGVCSGALSEYDMDGWTWASIDDVNALFNFYIGSNLLGMGPDTYSDVNTSGWATAFFNDGWRPTFFNGLFQRVYGYSSYDLTSNSDICYSPSFADALLPIPGLIDVAHTDSTKLRCGAGGSEGAWLYRVP
ncbi:MAG: hypothetical protein ACI9JM_000855 [Halioglobus sp.]|jgi:hypothetical protein